MQFHLLDKVIQFVQVIYCDQRLQCYQDLRNIVLLKSDHQLQCLSHTMYRIDSILDNNNVKRINLLFHTFVFQHKTLNKLPMPVMVDYDLLNPIHTQVLAHFN